MSINHYSKKENALNYCILKKVCLPLPSLNIKNQKVWQD